MSDLQHSKGGPIIAVQVENEYGSYRESPEHLTFVKDVLIRHGITELLVTSDNESAVGHTPYIDGVLPTANFQTCEEGSAVFDSICKLSMDYPLMVMEFWSGWFDYWGSGKHERRSVDLLEKTLEFCFEKNASVNFYMFFGGTNFGFMSGALNLSSFKPDVTSYDYDAPLAEDGSVTDKYLKIKEMIHQEKIKRGVTFDSGSGDEEKINQNPPFGKNRISRRRVISLDKMISWSDMTSLLKKTTSSVDPKHMETYQYADGDVQSYGYVIYRKCLDIGNKQKTAVSSHFDPSALEMKLPSVKDHANVLVNGNTVAVFDWKEEKPTVSLESKVAICESGTESGDQAVDVLDIVVENLGRVNYTDRASPQRLNTQRKGIAGQIRLGNSLLQDWQIIALDFNDEFIKDVSKSTLWKKCSFEDAPQQEQELTPIDGGAKSNNRDNTNGPVIYSGQFDVDEGEENLDAFVCLEGFVKGVVIVNGFNLGRYWNRGPQRTLYLPGPLLRKAGNRVLVFEESQAAKHGQISLEVEPILG